jgi:LacI family transcriptional regulator
LIAGNVQVEDGVEAGRRLLGLPNPPTAILASNNKLLLGVLQAVEERNLSIPKDLSVLGFDDNLWNMHFSPGLTAVAQLTGDIGRRSFELLHQLIKNPPKDDAAPMHELIPAQLRIRNSTARL